MSAPTNRSEGYAPYDVVVVPFPYADRLAEKRRPAIVVSLPELSARHGVVWLVMVTSAENRRWDCDIEISDLDQTGLPVASLVRPAKIATADIRRVLRRIGRLPAKDARAVRRSLIALLAT
jgi:mRNA interferase MazF